MDGGQSRADEMEEGVPPEDDAPVVAPEQAPKVKMLRIFAEKNPICFRQIEIRGVDGTNYALQSNGGTAAQSSTHMTPRSWNVAWAGRSYPAENLIDGDRTTGNHTQPDANGSWVVVELAEPQHIAEVVIYNSTSTYNGRRHAERAEGHELELVDEHGNACYHIACHAASTRSCLRTSTPRWHSALKMISSRWVATFAQVSVCL